MHSSFSILSFSNKVYYIGTQFHLINSFVILELVK
jgi:hypothetical protein